MKGDHVFRKGFAWPGEDKRSDEEKMRENACAESGVAGAMKIERDMNIELNREVIDDDYEQHN